MDSEEIIKKYSKRLQKDLNISESNKSNISSESISQEYEQFKKDILPEMSKYENWCRSFGNILSIKPSIKESISIQKQLDIAHLSITPGEAGGLALFVFLGIFLIDIISSGIYWYFTNELPIVFFIFIFLVSFFVYYYLSKMPARLATKWRLKAGSQMVPAVLYAVIYMKHTSNLERAIRFVSDHVEVPLALDFKKILWDVETGKYSNVKDSLDSYLEFWRENNLEFVESFHLIESSLYEPSEARRIEILERSLRVILDGVYEKMLKYTHSVKSPLTNLYMLGIVLPTLGLVLLVLAATLLNGMINAMHVFLLYNLLIPFFVYYMTSEIMISRPSGYGESQLIENNKDYPKYISNKPYFVAGIICLPLIIIGLIPLIIGFSPLLSYMGVVESGHIYDPLLSDFGINSNAKIFGFYTNSINGSTLGPFGIGSVLLSLFIPLAVALFFALAYSMKTKDLIKSREKTKVLEEEFTSTLFTLGNRIGDGIPAEIAFAKVAESTKGQMTENFFKKVNINIQSMGMNIEEAIFNKTRGAIIFYPSGLIATSMRILIESVKKGLGVAAESLMSISEYVKNIQKINERLRDLLADVVSDMKSNMIFLAPLLAGIVVGLSVMIIAILSQLKSMIESTGPEALSGLGVEGLGNIIDTMFKLENMIPPYYLQIAVGLYIVEIIFILTITLVTIDSGQDKLKQTYDISRNLFSGFLWYFIVSLVSTLVLATITFVALGPILSTG